MVESRKFLFKCESEWKLLILGLLVYFLTSFADAAAEALTEYTMDQRTDCISPGFLDVPRGQLIRLQAPSRDTSTSNKVLLCRLQFSAQTEGDTLKMTLDSSSYIGDCDVSLELQMTNSEKIIRGCESGNKPVPTLEAINGKATVLLTRKSHEDTSYWFQITITAVRTEVPESQGGASTGSVGEIVGIIAGVIAFLAIVVIISICCYRKCRGDLKEPTKNLYNNVLNNSVLTDSVHGYENNMEKISYENSFQKSPGSDRRLLDKNPKENGKPKSAVERFDHYPVSRDMNESRNTSTSKKKLELPRRERSIEPNNPEKPKDRFRQNELAVPSISFVSATQDSNEKLRKSYETESHVEEYARRISRSFISSSASEDSVNISTKTTQFSKSHHRSSAGNFQTQPFPPDRAGSDDESRSSGNENRNTEAEMGAIKDTKKSDKLSREQKTKDKKNKYETEDRIQEKYVKMLRRKHSQEELEDRKLEIKERCRKKITAESLEGDDDQSLKRENYREYEGRFKKSTSGRKTKSKGQKMERSRSTGCALEELDSNYQPTRSKSSSSIRTTGLTDNEKDDELDSNYTAFRRTESKTSLYASRSSLYGRRRKNSMGETVSMSSYLFDDVDSRIGDFDKTKLSYKEKERLFKSTGDLDLTSKSAVTLCDCATQTGSNKNVYIYGKKTFAKKNFCKTISHGSQTVPGYGQNGSLESVSSWRLEKRNKHLKTGSKSQDSKNEKIFGQFHHDEKDKEYHQRSVILDNKDYSEDEDQDSTYFSAKKTNKLHDKSNKVFTEKQKSKVKSKCDVMSHKSTGTPSTNISESDNENSAITSASASSVNQISQQASHMPQFIPTRYPVVYPQQAIAYMPAVKSESSVMFPIASLSHTNVQKMCSLAKTPNMTKWDQLVNLTEGMKKRRHQMGESLETESVLSSVLSQPAGFDSQYQTYVSSPYPVTQEVCDQGSQLTDNKTQREYVTGYSRKFTLADSNV